MSCIDLLQGHTRGAFLFTCLRGSKIKMQGLPQKHNIHTYARFWQKEENFWSKSCMCMVVLVKNVKWKAFTKEYLLVIPLTFTWFISASKRDLMIDIHKLNNTKKNWYSGQVCDVSDEGKIVLRGTWRMTMDSVNKWQALSTLPSSGTHPNSRGIGPTAAPAEGLAPGPWFNHCPARGEAKQATKLPSSFPSSCH